LTKPKIVVIGVHCSYHGTAEHIAGMYTDLRKKYRLIQKRITLAELRTR